MDKVLSLCCLVGSMVYVYVKCGWVMGEVYKLIDVLNKINGG